MLWAVFGIGIYTYDLKKITVGNYKAAVWQIF